MGRTISERLIVEDWGDCYGVILSKFPIPGSVRLYFFDGTVLKNPEHNELGDRIIIPKGIALKIETICDIYVNSRINVEHAVVRACYNERYYVLPDNFEEESFIKEKARTLRGLNEYVTLLKISEKLFPGRCPKEWILFGRYRINKYRQILPLDKCFDLPIVAPISDLEAGVIEYGELFLPKNGQKCPLCGEKFSLSDVQNGNCDRDTETQEICHKDCLMEYEKLKNKKQLAQIVQSAYNPFYFEKDLYNNEFQFHDYTECCPEFEYESREGKEWFAFSTSDGDIKIGQLTELICIVFLPGFREFPDRLLKNVAYSLLNKDGKKKVCVKNGGDAEKLLKGVFDYLHKKM